MTETAMRPSTTSQQAAALLFIHAQTGLHPGSGTSLGTVDLPVQRERHTDWPVIPGSTLKGIVRDACRPNDRQGEDWQKWQAVFGPEGTDAADHAGAASLTDARILAFPVRSIRGVFAWITCPAVIRRLNRDILLLNGLDDGFKAVDPVPRLEDTQFILPRAPNGHPLLVDAEKKLVLEEYEFTIASSEASSANSDLLRFIKAAVHPLSKDEVENRLVVLDDTWFTHFVRHATEVTARIALDYESKTTKGTALFYEEFLPPETLFYSVLLASASRRKFDKEQENDRRKSVLMSPVDVRDYVSRGIKNGNGFLQIGGDETIGKGLCAVRLVGSKEGA